MKYMRNYADETSFSEDSEVLSNIEQENKKWISYIKDSKGIKISLREQAEDEYAIAVYDNISPGSECLLFTSSVPVSYILSEIIVIDGGVEHNMEINNMPSNLTYTSQNNEITVKYKVSSVSNSVVLTRFFAETTIKSITDNFFTNFSRISSINGIFYGCEYLGQIPEKMFEKATSITDISECFVGCGKVKTLPSNLIKPLTNLLNITNAFSQSGIESIPEGFFDNCLQINNFSNAFFRCPLKGLTYTDSDGNELWEIYTNASGFNCFKDCTSLDNYNDIPEEWGGPADIQEISSRTPGYILINTVPDSTKTYTLTITAKVGTINKIIFTEELQYNSNKTKLYADISNIESTNEHINIINISNGTEQSYMNCESIFESSGTLMGLSFIKKYGLLLGLNYNSENALYLFNLDGIYCNGKIIAQFGVNYTYPYDQVVQEAKKELWDKNKYYLDFITPGLNIYAVNFICGPNAMVGSDKYYGVRVTNLNVTPNEEKTFGGFNSSYPDDAQFTAEASMVNNFSWQLVQEQPNPLESDNLVSLVSIKVDTDNITYNTYIKRLE